MGPMKLIRKSKKGASEREKACKARAVDVTIWGLNQTKYNKNSNKALAKLVKGRPQNESKKNEFTKNTHGKGPGKG